MPASCITHHGLGHRVLCLQPLPVAPGSLDRCRVGQGGDDGRVDLEAGDELGGLTPDLPELHPAGRPEGQGISGIRPRPSFPGSTAMPSASPPQMKASRPSLPCCLRGGAQLPTKEHEQKTQYSRLEVWPVGAVV